MQEEVVQELTEQRGEDSRSSFKKESVERAVVSQTKIGLEVLTGTKPVREGVAITIDVWWPEFGGLINATAATFSQGPNNLSGD